MTLSITEQEAREAVNDIDAVLRHANVRARGTLQHLRHLLTNKTDARA